MNTGFIPKLKTSTALICSAILVAGCTSNTAMMGDIRPVYKVQGDVQQHQLPSYYEPAKKHFIAKRYGIALDGFQADLRVNGKSIKVLNAIAACYDKLKRYDLAQVYYYQALDIDSESARTLGNLGYSFLLQGRHADARKVLTLALNKDADNNYVQQNLLLANRGYEQTLASTVVIEKAAALEEPVVESKEVQAETKLIVSTDKIKEPVAIISRAERIIPIVETMGVSLVIEEGNVDKEDLAAQQEENIVPASVAAVILPDTSVEVVSPVVDAGTDAALVQPREIVEEQKVVAIDTTVVELSGTVVEATQLEQAVVEISTVDVESGTAQVEPETVVSIEKTVLPEMVAVAEMDKKPDPSTEFVKINSDANEIIESHAAEVFVVQAPVQQQDMSVSVDAQSIGMGASAITIEVPAEDMAVVGRVVLEDASVSDVDGILDSRIELSNGNGRAGMARLFGDYLKSHGEQVVRLTNAKSYRNKDSVLYYRAGKRSAATQVADRFPVQLQLKESSENRNDIDVRVVIGHDVLFYESVVRRSLHDASLNVADNSIYRPDSGKAVAVSSIEISNGNGRRGMARLMQQVMNAEGASVNRITNADHFGHEKTMIYYSSGQVEAARQLAEKLPVDVVLKETSNNRSDIELRVVIGNDILTHEIAMRRSINARV